jgi:hypothetical protein
MTNGSEEGPKAVGEDEGQDASCLGPAQGCCCGCHNRDSDRRRRTCAEEKARDVSAGARKNQRGAEEALIGRPGRSVRKPGTAVSGSRSYCTFPVDLHDPSMLQTVERRAP